MITIEQVEGCLINAIIEPRIETREGGRLVYLNVKDNDRKGFVGRIARGQHAEVSPRHWIRLFGVNHARAFDHTFVIGDEAAYGAYNLTYTGLVTAVGPKTVTVQDDGTIKRLSVYDFLFWNWDFDARRTRAKNLATLQQI